MPKKRPISGRIPPETDERMEEYREKQDLNQSDALRKLLDAGLDVELHPEDEELAAEVGALTQTERWFEKKLNTAFGTVLLTAPVALVAMLSVGALQTIFGLAASHPAVLTMTFITVVSTFLFIVAALGAVATYVVLNTGLARRIESWYQNRQGAAL